MKEVEAEGGGEVVVRGKKTKQKKNKGFGSLELLFVDKLCRGL